MKSWTSNEIVIIDITIETQQGCKFCKFDPAKGGWREINNMWLENKLVKIWWKRFIKCTKGGGNIFPFPPALLEKLKKKKKCSREKLKEYTPLVYCEFDSNKAKHNTYHSPKEFSFFMLIIILEKYKDESMD